MKIPKELAVRIDGLERNNPDEAEAIVSGLILELGYCPSSVAHYFLMLQDQPDDLRRRLVGRNILTEAGEEDPR